VPKLLEVSSASSSSYTSLKVVSATQNVKKYVGLQTNVNIVVRLRRAWRTVIIINH